MMFRNQSRKIFITYFLAKNPQQAEPIIGFTPKNRLTISQIGSREPLYFKVQNIVIQKEPNFLVFCWKRE